MDEGARYNIGNVSRNINVPTLALTLLTPRIARACDSSRARSEDARHGGGVQGDGPAHLHQRPRAVADLPVYGRFWVDPADRHHPQTELHAVDATVEAHITVTFAAR